LDPGTILPPPGKIVVAFNNQTDRVVRFYAYALEDAQDVGAGFASVSSDVAPGEVRSGAFDCPVAALAPGGVNADFTIDGVGATYDFGGAAPVAVTYTGSPAYGERGDFVCGDVIEIQLIQTIVTGGTNEQDNQSAFEFRVQVYPGR